MNTINVKELLVENLKSLENQVSDKDRKACEKASGYDLSTISRYLKGDVRNVSTGEVIYVFLKKRINSKIKRIQNA